MTRPTIKKRAMTIIQESGATWVSEMNLISQRISGSDLARMEVENILQVKLQMGGKYYRLTNQLVPVERIAQEEPLRFPGMSKVYTVDGYNRSTKKWTLQAWDDINQFREVKKGTLLEIGFDF